MKTIVLGADHGGFELKNTIKNHLENKGYTVIDVGTNSSDSCDYPVFASKACAHVLSGEADLGILVCGTGIGMSMAANKHKGIRAACCSDTFSARLTRLHNNANFLCIGARVLGAGLALDLVDEFVNAEFEGDRHTKRLSLIEDIENGKAL
jgi:ribose 5-phosphate isomerase B